MGAIDINTFTIEQYLALTRRDRPDVVIPELGNDVDFEIQSQFMSELRCNLFACTDEEDAHEHVRRVLEITDLFHIPGVTRDAMSTTRSEQSSEGSDFLQRFKHPFPQNGQLSKVGCKFCKEVHLTKERPLNQDGNEERAEQLTQEILTNNMIDNAKTKMRKDIEVRKELVPFDLPNANPYVEPTVPRVPFPRHLKEQEDEAQAFRTFEGLKS
ncbi:hypothetical protein Tco_0077203 [Tanacetum coccineum]